MTTGDQRQALTRRQQAAVANLRAARCRQLAANAATPAEEPGGRPVMLTEEQLLADDAVEVAEIDLSEALSRRPSRRSR